MQVSGGESSAATEGTVLAEEKKCIEKLWENQPKGRLLEARPGLHLEMRPSGYSEQTEEDLLPQDSGKLRDGRAHN